MATRAWFVKAADNTRPYKSHRYDVFRPKIQRMLTFFNRAQVDAWLLLESDPLVLSCCERPMVVPNIKPKLLLDFWVGYAKRDELWLACRNTQAVSDLQASLPAFAAWAKVNHYTLRQISQRYRAVSRYFTHAARGCLTRRTAMTKFGFDKLRFDRASFPKQLSDLFAM